MDIRTVPNPLVRHFRPDTVTDLVWEVTSSLLNPLVGMVKHPQPVTKPVGSPLPSSTSAWIRADQHAQLLVEADS